MQMIFLNLNQDEIPGFSRQIVGKFLNIDNGIDKLVPDAGDRMFTIDKILQYSAREVITYI